MRIASLLPSATEIVFRLGLEDQLVAVSADCDYPAEVAQLPSLTTYELDEEMDSREIDRAVKEQQHAGRSLYHLDEGKLQDLQPDLVLTQEQCEVCAPAFDDVTESCKILDGEPRVVSLEAHTLRGIFESIRTVGQLADAGERAADLTSELEERVETLVASASGSPTHHRVLTLEWLDPFFVGGHWVPEMVQRLGAESYLDPGSRSREIDRQDLRDHEPEVTVLMPCGFDLNRTVREGKELLDGIDRGLLGDNVYAVDGSSYFSRPGPRVVRGFEILTSVLHPGAVDPSVLPDDAVEKLA